MTDIKINKVSVTFNDKAVGDVGNLVSPEGENHFTNLSLNNTSYTTNRILEIPQDIKLELNSGTLTLKAGSKICRPNGFEQDGTTPHFDIYIVENDIVDNNSGHNLSNELLTIRFDGNTGPWLFWFTHDYCYSGSTAPTVPATYAYWYDTTTNKMRWTGNSGSSWSTVAHSFPIAVGTTNSSGATVSIDQIFNGFGYIGSTVFIIKDGIKVQMPNGRNSDGTCKSVIINHSGVVTQTYTNTTDVLFDVFIAEGQTWCLRSPAGTTLYYDPERNLVIDSGLPNNRFIIGNAFFKGGRCNSVTPLATDSLANSNASNFTEAGRGYLSKLGMPSNHNISLTIGANNTKYTATANGYFVAEGKSTAANGYIILHGSTVINTTGRATVANQYMATFIPVHKGQVMSLMYASMTVNSLIFTYAEGES